MWVQTLVTLTANTSVTLLAANPRRERMRWMVTGTGAVTIAPGLVTVVVGGGIVYGPAASVGQEGGADDFQFDCSRGDFSAIATANTQMTIWEYVTNRGTMSATVGPGNNSLNATP